MGHAQLVTHLRFSQIQEVDLCCPGMNYGPRVEEIQLLAVRGLLVCHTSHCNGL